LKYQQNGKRITTKIKKEKEKIKFIHILSKFLPCYGEEWFPLSSISALGTSLQFLFWVLSLLTGAFSVSLPSLRLIFWAEWQSVVPLSMGQLWRGFAQGV
jgi:hypothetical protein